MTGSIQLYKQRASFFIYGESETFIQIFSIFYHTPNN